MSTITNYDILQRGTRQDLVDAVKIALKNGWQPIGGIAREGRANGAYFQAIVKYAETLGEPQPGQTLYLGPQKIG